MRLMVNLMNVARKFEQRARAHRASTITASHHQPVFPSLNRRSLRGPKTRPPSIRHRPPISANNYCFMLRRPLDLQARLRPHRRRRLVARDHFIDAEQKFPDRSLPGASPTTKVIKLMVALAVEHLFGCSSTSSGQLEFSSARPSHAHPRFFAVRNQRKARWPTCSRTSACAVGTLPLLKLANIGRRTCRGRERQAASRTQHPDADVVSGGSAGGAIAVPAFRRCGDLLVEAATAPPASGS